MEQMDVQSLRDSVDVVVRDSCVVEETGKMDRRKCDRFKMRKALEFCKGGLMEELIAECDVLDALRSGEKQHSALDQSFVVQQQARQATHGWNLEGAIEQVLEEPVVEE